VILNGSSLPLQIGSDPVPGTNAPNTDNVTCSPSSFTSNSDTNGRTSPFILSDALNPPAAQLEVVSSLPFFFCPAFPEEDLQDMNFQQVLGPLHRGRRLRGLLFTIFSQWHICPSPSRWESGPGPYGRAGVPGRRPSKPSVKPYGRPHAPSPSPSFHIHPSSNRADERPLSATSR